MLVNKAYKAFVAFFCMAMLLSSCEEQLSHNGKTPLVGVDKEFLYKEDVEQLFAANSQAGDSVLFVQEYIRHWLEDVLLYRMARRNVPNTAEVDRLVDSYKKSLLLNMYQEGLVEQHLRREISDAEIEDFYNANKGLFKVSEPMLQGIYIKVSKKAPQMASVRRWMKGESPEDLEKLEKYSLMNAVAFEYFADNWHTLQSVAAKMPLTADGLKASLARNAIVECSDTASVYLLNATAMLFKGEQKPLDMAAAEIRELLVNSMKADFVKEVKRDLYNRAIESGEVKFYDKKSSAALAGAGK